MGHDHKMSAYIRLFLGCWITLLRLNGLQNTTLLWIPVIRASFLSCQRIDLFMFLKYEKYEKKILIDYDTNLDIWFHNSVSKLWMIQEHFLLSHLLDSIISVALHGVVVLVDLYSESATRGEVVRLGKVTQTMMLDCLQRWLSQCSMFGWKLTIINCLELV